ncbi:hypothetical protein [Polaromonas sp. SM01]|uniref:hypothetical protein n=1 Tax=Polaromonas sp. SM01 TaxID=3085630 RepID=UPI002980F696|nr:hypothetical protein [Polaromonas sp. SM01]MDW5441319.1 hypothetical protein [Polaromonas sp. SM01]
MPYSKQFFDLQFHFASRVATLSGMPLASALLDYTNFYIRFGLGREFDAAHPAWREYLNGLERPTDQEDWTFSFYRACRQDVRPPSVIASVGCFSYARLGSDHIRLHFQNTETEGHSPLALERREHRLAELRTLFSMVRQSEHPQARVVGTSWLYNLTAYRRLFPEAYLATAVVTGPRFRNMPLWGQFLDRHGAVKQGLAAPFLRRLANQSTLDELSLCFPFQALELEAPVSAFYVFHGL